MKRIARLLAAAIAILAGANIAAANERIALVIGNAAYPDIPLANPVNDARLIATALRGQGFEVIETLDAGENEMKLAIKEFGNLLKAADGAAIGLLYYAGHGVQVQGQNYLIPIDAQIEDEGDVDIYSISANAVLRTLEDARNGLNIETGPYAPTSANRTHRGTWSSLPAPPRMPEMRQPQTMRPSACWSSVPTSAFAISATGASAIPSLESASSKACAKRACPTKARKSAARRPGLWRCRRPIHCHRTAQPVREC